METKLSIIADVIEKYPYAKTIILSLILVLILVILQKMIFLTLERKQLTRIEMIFLKKRISQYLRYITIILLLLFWFSQLQVLFVSMIAIAAAIVIAFKELIMCLTGGLLIRSTKPFVPGQRIEIANTRGFVIDSGLLVTKVLEIGPEKNSQQTTGDIITLPNSLMLSSAVKNESYFRGYSIKSYQFRVWNKNYIEKFERELLKKATDFSFEYIEDAKNSINRFCEKEGIAIPTVIPRIKLILDEEFDGFLVLVKVPVKNELIGDLEQELNRFYLSWSLKFNDNENKKESTDI